MSSRYNPKEIEPKWQKTWADQKLYEAIDFDETRPKYVMLTEFPYPSGDGLHLGHVREYTLGDIMARYKRMTGHNVLYPMGYDAFGLPTENYAIKNKIAPQVATDRNVSNFQKQFESLGYSIDWDRSFRTTDPSYYKWTQWLFLQFYKAGLAYQDETTINWCPHCKTGLANEEVVNGRHERCDTLVEKKTLKQWLLKITDYADRLIDGLSTVDYPSRIADQQINWIGRSKGAEVDFSLRKVVNPNPEMARTYIMGQKNISEEDIKKLGGRIEEITENGHLCVEFPINKTEEFEGLINKKMEPGFWNEYITNEQAVFIFKYKDGKTERFELNDDNAHQICVIGNQFNDHSPPKPKETAWQWLENNAWYAPIVPKITVFTTRPDTLFGATFMVLAPEHPIVDKITTVEQKAIVNSYIKTAGAKSEIERQDTNREKTGVFTGAYAINPVNNEKIPIWIADYVLAGYGTGAIMAVPAHDERDNAFAKKYELPIKPVVEPLFGKQQGNEHHKNGIIALVRKSNTNEYLVLNWGPRMDRWGGNLFIGGGVDDEEDIIEAAKREIAEETGYTDVELISQSAVPGNSYYYSNVKDRNDHAYCTGLLFELKSDKQIAQNLDEGEKNKFTTMWVKEADIPNTLYTGGLHYWFFRELVLGECYTEEGIMINSGTYDGMSSSEAREKIAEDLQDTGAGKEKVTYKLRDWIFSRQHYWGEPIPIIHCKKCGAVPVPDDQLPVELPPVDHYEPTDNGESPLALIESWVNVDCPKCGGKAKRETDTMPNWAGSSWYYLRYFDAHNVQAFADKKKLEYWGMVDMYLGGMEHTTLHLLYSRFWHQFFYDQGLVPTPEPYFSRRGQGIILAADGTKMSKSKGNVVNPTEIIDAGYGADALRLSIAFIAPYDQTTPWNPEGVAGTHRFVSRVWTLVNEYLERTDNEHTDESKELLIVTNQAIAKVSKDLYAMGFNTAVSSLMEYVNALYKIKAKDGYASREWEFALITLIKLLAPFAPHITEELWQKLGQIGSVHVSEWPIHDEKYLVSDTVTIVVQVNGKVRGQLQIASGGSQEDVEKLAREDEKVASYLIEGVKKVVFVPDKLISFVV